MKRCSGAGGEAAKARSSKSANLTPGNSQGTARLRQILDRVKKVGFSAEDKPAADWLRPFMTPKTYRKGEAVFRKDDPAKEMFLAATGKFLVVEMGIELQPGRFFGEIGFWMPGNLRTMTVECIEDGEALSITYEELLKLFFHNPEFGFHCLAVSVEAMVRLGRLFAELREKNIELERSYAVVRQQASQLEIQAHELSKFNQESRTACCRPSKRDRTRGSASTFPAPAGGRSDRGNPAWRNSLRATAGRLPLSSATYAASRVSPSPPIRKT
jgi:CRP-like cAMP-binding protein